MKMKKGLILVITSALILTLIVIWFFAPGAKVGDQVSFSLLAVGITILLGGISLSGH